MKKKNILFLIIAAIFLPMNMIATDGFFRYKNLSNGVKLAIEDYDRVSKKKDTLLVMTIIKQDSLTFTLNVNVDVTSFIDNPPLYYSIYKNCIVLIYNGEEINYHPSPIDLALMFDFISNIIDTSEITKCDWSKYEFTRIFKLGKYENDFVDYPIKQYQVDNNSILRKEYFYDTKMDDYSMRRFKPKYR